MEHAIRSLPTRDTGFSLVKAADTYTHMERPEKVLQTNTLELRPA